MIINIQIDEKSNYLIKEGDKVDFETPFREKFSQSTITIDIAKKLDIDPSKIFRYLKKLVGEEIKKNQIIALKHSLLKSIKIISEYDGHIKEVDHNTGKITLNIDRNEKSIEKCFFKGKIKSIKNNEVKIEVNKGNEYSLKIALNNFGGEVLYLKNEDNLYSSNVSKKIVIIDSISDYFQTKAEALGARGFVTLIKLSDPTELNQALIKNIDDIKKIIKDNYPYCIINRQDNKIIFYQ